MAGGGYGIVYQATWLNVPKNNYYAIGENEIVVLKRFKNSQYFLNEVNTLKLNILQTLNKISNYYCNNSKLKINNGLIETYGFTIDHNSCEFFNRCQFVHSKSY